VRLIVDWASFGWVQVGRARRRLSCLVMTLSYSRAFYLEFFFDQRLENFLQAHVNAFAFCGGAPRQVLPDYVARNIIIQDADDKHCRKVKQRCINGALGLKVPVEVIRAKCSKYLKHEKPIQRAERLSDSDFTIVAQYQAEYRGVVQYYLRAFNVHRLWKLHCVMKLSLAKTLADKHRTSVRKVLRKYQTVVSTAHGTLKVLEVIQPRGAEKKPLVARFWGSNCGDRSGLC
jgi:hypothetical protein